MIIAWKKQYNTGIESVDNQHKKLVEMINSLEEAKGKENKDKIVHDIFYNLIDYTKYHFSEEEKLMGRMGYPHLNEHKAQHKVLVKQIVEILENLKEKKFDIGEKLNQMLYNWLIKHILDHDKQYVDYKKS